MCLLAIVIKYFEIGLLGDWITIEGTVNNTVTCECIQRYYTIVGEYGANCRIYYHYHTRGVALARGARCRGSRRAQQWAVSSDKDKIGQSRHIGWVGAISLHAWRI